jgi:ABC-type transport system involved in cytochrome bd biosynthesis fused ATPase/permease subunit
MAVGEVVATAAAINAINRIGNSVSDRIDSNLVQNATGMRARFLKTFQSHLAKSLQKSGSVKTVVSKDKPVKLESIYVPLCLLHDEKTIEGDELDPTINAGRRTIVSGTGGAGKTILMKHLLNISVANPNETG